MCAHKEEMLDLAGVQKFTEAFIKYDNERAKNIFSYVTKKEFPGTKRKLYYDFYAGATGHQYQAGDLQKLATTKGRNLLRRLVAMFGGMDAIHMEEACDENGIHGEARGQYMSIDFAMDIADRIHSGRRLYLAHVGRMPSTTKPADREHFNLCDGAGLNRFGKDPAVFVVEDDVDSISRTPKPARRSAVAAVVPTCLNPKFHLSGRRGMTHHRDAEEAAEAERTKQGECALNVRDR